MRPFFAALFLIGMAASGARGGLLFTRSDGTRISIEGRSYRIDYPASPEPRTSDAVIAPDGDTDPIYVNSANNTWYRRSDSPVGSTSRRFGSPFRTRLRKPPLVEVSQEPGEEIAGRMTEKTVLHVSYELEGDYDGTKARSTVEATFLLWSSREVPGGPPLRISTPYAVVNDAITKAVASLGTVLQQTTSVTEAFEGGRPATDTSTWTTRSIEERTFPPSLFQVPAAYTHQAPQYGVPGATITH